MAGALPQYTVNQRCEVVTSPGSVAGGSVLEHCRMRPRAHMNFSSASIALATAQPHENATRTATRTVLHSCRTSECYARRCQPCRCARRAPASSCIVIAAASHNSRRILRSARRRAIERRAPQSARCRHAGTSRSETHTQGTPLIASQRRAAPRLLPARRTARLARRDAGARGHLARVR